MGIKNVELLNYCQSFRNVNVELKIMKDFFVFFKQTKATIILFNRAILIHLVQQPSQCLMTISSDKYKKELFFFSSSI